MAEIRHIPMFRPYVNDKARALVQEVLSPRPDGSFWIGEGPKVRQLEESLKQKFGWKHVVATNSGTSALHLALAIAGVGPGDEVLSTPMTCSATNQAIKALFATPVFADIQYTTGNLDPCDVERNITPFTKAIVCVHWAGYPCDMNELCLIAIRHKIALIEDAAHALGATYKTFPIGAFPGSDFTMFSLQSIKQLTAIDGGVLTMWNPDWAEAARRRRWFGIDRENRRMGNDGYGHFGVTETGYKMHMNDVSAAVGLGNLEDIDWLMAQRHEQAAFYREQLAGVPGVQLFERKPDRTSGDWLFTMHVERRMDFIRMMREKGVECSVVHLRNDDDDDYPVFGGRRDDLPVMDAYERTYCSIPIGWWVSAEDAAYICDCIKGGW